MSTTNNTTRGLAQAKALKRANAVTAMLSGGVPALILGLSSRAGPEEYVIGFLFGLLWANGFEYAYHRFLLHLPGNFFAKRHLEHHAVTGTPAEAEHVNLGGSPLAIFLLFVANGAPIVAADLAFKLGIAPAMLIAFAIYFVAVEEIHWRFHLGGWLPASLSSAREHHLAHHDRPDGRFNVFFPLFDWLICSAGSTPCLWSRAGRLPVVRKNGLQPCRIAQRDDRLAADGCIAAGVKREHPA